MTGAARESAYHYHAANSSLTKAEAAECVYGNRQAAAAMVKTFVQLANLAGARVRETGDHQYEINERGTVHTVGIERCKQSDCPKPQAGRGRR